jgi:hypothetical protein
MSTEINITIGDQRLLQESKTRAAANQQSLDSRLEEQQLAEQLTEAVDEATPEDPRSDAFSLQLDRRPAAQRRKKEKIEIGFIGADKLRSRYLPETRVDYKQEWNESYFYRIINPFIMEPEYIFTLTNPRVNTYTYYTGGLHPVFALVEKESNQTQAQKTTLLNFPSYPVHYDIEDMNFVVRTLNFIRNKSGEILQIASTAPPLPLNINSIKRTITIYTMFSCISGKIYYSTLLRIYKASSTVIDYYNDPDLYYARTAGFNFSVIGLSEGVFFSLKSGAKSVPIPAGASSSEGFTDFIYTQFTNRNSGAYLDFVRSLPYDYNPEFAAYDDIGIYTVYDLNTNTTTTRSVNISNFVNNDPSLSAYYDVTQPVKSVGPLYYFFNNLDAEDPEYEFFREYISKLSGTDVFIKSQANRYGPQWPRYAYYSRQERIVYILIFGSSFGIRDVWFYKFKAGEPVNTYSEVLTFILSLGRFTAETLRERGFQYVDSVDISFVESQYPQNRPAPAIKFNGKF